MDCHKADSEGNEKGCHSHDTFEYSDMLLRFWVALALTLPILILSMGDFHHPFLELLLATPVVLGCGWPFFQKGWESFRSGRLNMFSLISLGIGVSYIFSVIVFILTSIDPEALPGYRFFYFESAAVITVLVLLGQVLEMKAREKTGKAVEKLLQKAAKTALKIEKGQEKEIPVEEVKEDDILRVLPGSLVPVDGVVLEGESVVDESMMTGEAFPVEKGPHDKVLGATLNLHGSFLMRAEKVGENTTLARIVRAVKEAEETKAPIQNLADRVSAVFVPTVITIALLTFLGWGFFGPEPSWVYGILNAVSVLIIACPCALGLATPMSLVVGMGKGAESGILIKSGDVLEKIENIHVVAFDKTGTLTEGKPSLTHIETLFPWTEKESLHLAANLEQNSEHPLAKSIKDAYKRRLGSFSPLEQFKVSVGGGVEGLFEGKKLTLGKRDFLLNQGVFIAPSLDVLAFERQQEGETSVFLGVDKEAIGFFAFTDLIREGTEEALKELDNLGIGVVLLSGDSAETTETVADKLDIANFEGGLLPEDKHRWIREIQRNDPLVAMAGDGINDAPALAAADVGIAMGTGTDIAIESADVTLVRGDLNGVKEAIVLSKAVMRNIRENLFLAFIYNLVGIVVATGIFFPWTGWTLNPMLAALAMSLSSVSVVLNALRLGRLNLKRL